MKPAETQLPVGRWNIAFANGVHQACEVDEDGTAFAVEPRRASPGKAEVKGQSVTMVFQDNRVERWTPVAQTMIVEHWCPAAQYPSGTPVLGIARLDERTGHARLTAWERDRVEEASPALVKHFIATLRQPFTATTAGELRSFIDPRYLKEHKLLEGAFPIQTVVTTNMHDLRPVSGEPQTILVIVETEAATKEVFLFRTTYYLGKVYLLPLAPPDLAAKSFTPWIIRAKL
jgi:hypothetical protein